MSDCWVCGSPLEGTEPARGHVDSNRIHHELCSVACPECEARDGQETVVIDLTDG